MASATDPIVVGYDGSEGSKAALEQAIELARGLGAPLLVTFAYGANPVGGVGGALQKKLIDIGEERLAEAKSRADEAGVAVTTELVDALPVDGLVALADARGARMLVLGGNGRGPMIGTLLGSVGYKILNRTTVPVLVVQPDAE